VADHVVIDRRFRGPPDLGQGGYACGLVGERVDAPVASVSLRKPVPLETPLEVRAVDGVISLLDPSGETVADGGPAELDLTPPPPPTIGEANAASARSPMRREPARHPFPTCFGCGLDRDPGEAMRIIPGPLVDQDYTRLATTWTPLHDFADSDGAVSELFMWAALDCPTGWAAAPLGADPHVLARLTGHPLANPVTVGEPHVVVAWLIGREGRKSRGGVAIYGPAGELCALAEGLWIQLRDPSSHGAVTNQPFKTK
jgi:hypothetical protein